MLAQFQSLYPNGNLISELVQIFQGKFIVRASVQIEGVTRATGMAAAETIEAAEDQARTRALMVLGITNSPQATVAIPPKTTSQVQPSPALNTTNTTVGFRESTYSSPKDADVGSSHWSLSSGKEISIPSFPEENINSDIVTTDTRSAAKSEIHNQDLSQSLSLPNNQEVEFDTPVKNLEPMSDNQPETPLFSGGLGSNVTPFTPRNYTQENVSPHTGTGKKKKKTEPVNLSDVIAKTDVQIERLGWTKEQGREYLKKTYGKLGRSLLSEEELLDFLRYLESQPDPVAGF
ncbi:hypothetical protein NIES4103_51250 [Nostoc sp. NIES-4103]|nr:hypothetical protein NIES4103_51250 [Nostoc sp. NIES-4103]